jgi:hypothetical protein
MQREQIYVEIRFIFIRLDSTDAIFHNEMQRVVKYHKLMQQKIQINDLISNGHISVEFLLT